MSTSIERGNLFWKVKMYVPELRCMINIKRLFLDFSLLEMLPGTVKEEGRKQGCSGAEPQVLLCYLLTGD